MAKKIDDSYDEFDELDELEQDTNIPQEILDAWVDETTNDIGFLLW